MRVIASLPVDDWRAVPAAAQAAETMGYDGVQTSELAHDLFAPLAIAALQTSRVELATGIAVAFPRSPMVVANIAWDMQANSGGRFHLGLGTQVKGHNERRFSVPWVGSPVTRMREYVEALRAIWRCWERGAALDYEGEHYRFTLMTPEFSPQPTGLPMVPVSVAAVGPDMLRMAGRICDGVRLHGFCTRRYIENVALKRIEEGLETGGRTREQVEISGGGFIATGPDDAAVAKMMDWVRYRVAFYGSTRTYWPVFEQHDLVDLGARLHAMSKAGQWNQMAAEVSDDVVRLFAAVGRHDEIVAAIEARFGGLVDALRVNFPEPGEGGLMRELIEDIRRIPTPFTGFRTAA
ncbi:MAG TPA: TIGR03617 family F420-dependent LLM class oxidoreductase [Alphaproteobacteria bacterium]|nr:TIGR03617 family F420-dependent LLM class oxidoreductase [Alphaproteobacteria bacterium]